MTFRDHFSGVSRSYAAFRPTYPDALFEGLAARSPGRRLAWDCATGSGQAATGLAPHFDRVLATDASLRQVSTAAAHPRVAYLAARAEATPIPDHSADLITVAQAVHWFDLDPFWREVRRVLVPRGVIAVWCYVRFRIEPAVDDLVNAFYDHTVGPFWPAERSLVEEGYRTLQFPFEEFSFPDLFIERAMTLPELGGYLRTWSSTQRYTAARGTDPVVMLLRELAPAWGDPARSRAVRWPLHLRAGTTR